MVTYTNLWEVNETLNRLSADKDFFQCAIRKSSLSLFDAVR